MIPFFVLFVVYYKLDETKGGGRELFLFAAITCYIVAALSDGLDGYIARKYNQVSRLGTILDPIADKGLELVGIIVLSYKGNDELPHFPPWFVVLFFAREILILIGYILLHHFNKVVLVKPHWTGKVSTALLMALVCYMLLNLKWMSLNILVISTAFFMTVSLLMYLGYAIRELNAGGSGKAS